MTPMHSDDAAIRARLAAIVDSSHDAILAKDTAGTVTAWNPAAERLYGYTADEMVGRSVSLIIPEELIGESDFILAEVVAGRSVPPYDTERVTKSGARVPVSIAVSPVRDTNGTVVGASTIARDMSARLAAEAERAWTAMLIRQSADGIVALDETGVISTWNPAAEELFGYSEREALGRRPEDVVHADDPADQFEVSESVRAGRTRRYEAVRRHRDGHELIVQISIAPLDGPGQRHRGAVVSIRDVTAARRAETLATEAQLRETALVRELEQTRRLESVGQLAGGIAHDFNNLLGVILNLAAFVAEDLPAGSQTREDAEEIGLAAKRAATLTRQLLIFSRRDIVEPEVFDPGALVSGLHSFLTRALGENVDLEVSADDELWSVSMDRGQLEQIVVNLAINGRDAMPSGGRLIVETRNTVVDEEFAKARVGLSPGNYVTLTVSDTGSGMDAEVLARAFEPFFTTKPEGQGTGLGLSTVYGIAAQVGGRVALYSEPGRGTAVHVHLPATLTRPERTEQSEAPAPGGRGERILVVEDAADVRSITERILRKAGYDVTACCGADEALEILAGTRSVDLVLTDVVMPGRPGTELVELIRARDPGTRVLFMSGYSNKMLTDEVLQHPASKFIEKPFTADQLRRKVLELLGTPANGEHDPRV
ncbi:MAG: PAS domain S-box protein [Solirubrobacteraceae bacterium]|nr:PAS domain S-box protein [Solirubrobacteraceae bacterium]